MEAGPVALSVALEGLRQELEEALKAGQGREVGFRVSDVTLTLQAVAQRDKGGGGKLRWWVIEAGADIKHSQAETQTLVVKLTPQFRRPDGESEPLDVKGKQSGPGG